MNDNKEPFYQQIEAFLLDRLDTRARDEMIRAIESDPELATAVRIRRLEFEVSEMLIADDIRAQIGRLRAPEPPPAPESPRNNGFHFMLWAIAVLTGGGSLLWFYRSVGTQNKVPQEQQQAVPPETTKPPIRQDTINPAPSKRPQENTAPTEGSRYIALAQKYYGSPEMDDLRRGATTDSLLDIALENWNQGNYAVVEQQLRAYPSDAPNYFRALHLRAHSTFRARRYALAARDFSALADSGIQPWSEEAQWYATLALLASGKSTSPDFRRRFAVVLSDNGHPFYEKASALKSDLGR